LKDKKAIFECVGTKQCLEDQRTWLIYGDWYARDAKVTRNMSPQWCVNDELIEELIEEYIEDGYDVTIFDEELL
jgi:hypothetical protein